MLKHGQTYITWYINPRPISSLGPQALGMILRPQVDIPCDIGLSMYYSLGLYIVTGSYISVKVCSLIHVPPQHLFLNHSRLKSTGKKKWVIELCICVPIYIYRYNFQP